MVIRRRKKTRRPIDVFKPTYETGRQRRQAQYRAERPEVRRQAWDDAKGRCQWPTCRTFVSLDAMHAHELVFRSHRLLGALDITNVMCLCGRCHGDLHSKIGGVLKKILDAALGLSGARFWERKTGKSPWIEVTRGRG